MVERINFHSIDGGRSPEKRSVGLSSRSNRFKQAAVMQLNTEDPFGLFGDISKRSYSARRR